MSLADGMENFETRRSNGFCGGCNKQTDALWERCGRKLTVSCEDCGKIYICDENRFAQALAQKEKEDVHKCSLG